MTQPKTVSQYRKFFSNLGISHLEIKEKYGDLRKRETWEKAYGDYVIPNLPIIKAINEATRLKSEPANPKPIEVLVIPVVEMVEVPEVVESSSTLEKKSELVATPRPLVALYSPDSKIPGKLYQLETLEVLGGSFAIPQLPLGGSFFTLNKRFLNRGGSFFTPTRWGNLPIKFPLKLPQKFARERSPPKQSQLFNSTYS